MTWERWQGPYRPAFNGAEVLKLQLQSDHDAPAATRAAIATLRLSAQSDVIERTTLLASEVVSNSVRHADCDEIRVEIRVVDHALWVVVADDGDGFDPPNGDRPEPGSTGGYGLPLVDTLSESWGSGSDHESWVWFEVGPRA